MAIGIPQDDGLGLQDSQFIAGITQGQNASSQVLTAFAGGGQGSAKQISPTAALVQIGVVGTANDSLKLPFAIKGQTLLMFNSTVTSANVFGQVPLNRTTGLIDTINGVAGSTAYAIAGGVSVLFFCAANGAWAALKSA